MKKRRRVRQPRLPIVNDRLEVHEHSYVSGPRARGGYGRDGKWLQSKFAHSHEGGDRRHRHPETGPAAYTIDKDEWFRTTGLRGGGRKTFTFDPTGEQLPIVELDEDEHSFEVIVMNPSAPPGFIGEGGGFAAAARMVLQFGLKARVRRG